MRERLNITLTLTLAGQSHTIPGANVRTLALELTSYGVRGSLEFVVHDDSAQGGKYTDDVLADFIKPDLGEIQISIQAAHLETQTEAADAAIATGGILIDREVEEESFAPNFGEPAVLARRYRVSFVDAAAALWRQHFPCDLFTNKSFKDAIEAHKGAKVTLSYDWDPISAVAPQVFFHLDPDAGASFYDLVLGYVRDGAAIWSFDHTARTYAIQSKKVDTGTAATLLRDDVHKLVSVFPEVPRHAPRVLCSYTEATRNEAVDQPQAALGVFHDLVMRTPIAKQVDDSVALEKARPILPSREVRLGFARFPTLKTAPGSLIAIGTDGGFSPDLLSAPDGLRVFRLELEARALDPGVDVEYGENDGAFELSISAWLEDKNDARGRFPALRGAAFPGFLEGKVVSEVGADTDLTYQIYPNQDTSVDYYEVKIPLFANQIVVAPYEPHSASGAFYLPLYKGQRVLVALDFAKSSIRSVLDWRGEARVPADGQGQHLFLGKSAKSNTSLLHDYQDEKPVFRVLRSNDKDTALLRFEEGKLTLKVEEASG